MTHSPSSISGLLVAVALDDQLLNGLKLECQSDQPPEFPFFFFSPNSLTENL